MENRNSSRSFAGFRAWVDLPLRGEIDLLSSAVPKTKKRKPEPGFGLRLGAVFRRLRLRHAKKIVIGASGIGVPGWIATEQKELDVTKWDSFARYWSPGTRRAFFAEHVWEHLTPAEADAANANCFGFLARGGRLRIAVPDGLHPDPLYREHVAVGGTGPGAEDHKVLYNYHTLRRPLETAGFDVELLEYWDEEGKFHARDWASAHGHVLRSKNFDPRNQGGELRYTSLIVDAIKPV